MAFINRERELDALEVMWQHDTEDYMDTQNWFDVEEFVPGVYMITEAQRFNSFLVVGSEKALLIDSGLGIGDIKRLVESITDKPLELVLTHTHWDHRGAVHQFDQVGVHLAEAHQVMVGVGREQTEAWIQQYDTSLRPLPEGFDPNVYEIPPARATYPLQDGDLINLGRRRLTVYHTPGHSPGGLSFLDEPAGVLFSGDTVKPLNPLYAHLPGSDIADYVASMVRLAGLAPQVNVIVSGHTPPFDDHSILQEMAEGLQAVASGVHACQMVGSRWGKVKEYAFERFAVWTN